MRLYSLGRLPWVDTQVIYHTLAREGIEAVVLCGATDPYVCVGFHQDLRKEIDLEYCAANGIGTFRREAGGGAVYMDRGQFFFQVIVPRDSDRVPHGREQFYRFCLDPVREALRTWGVEAEFVPACDLVVRGKKISGNGGGEIGSSWVFIGNILLSFDTDRMARALVCPSEAFRRLYRDEMARWLTTLEGEIGRIPPWPEIEGALAAAFTRALGPLVPTTVDADLRAAMDRVRAEMMADPWRFYPGPRRPQGLRRVKVREGRFIIEIPPDAAVAVDVPAGKEPDDLTETRP